MFFDPIGPIIVCFSFFPTLIYSWNVYQTQFFVSATVWGFPLPFHVWGAVLCHFPIFCVIYPNLFCVFPLPHHVSIIICWSATNWGFSAIFPFFDDLFHVLFLFFFLFLTFPPCSLSGVIIVWVFSFSLVDEQTLTGQCCYNWETPTSPLVIYSSCLIGYMCFSFTFVYTNSLRAALFR